MPVDRDHHFARIHAEFLGRRIQNSFVGLMRHKPINIGQRNARGGNNLFHHFRHVDHGMAKDFFALHPHMANGPGTARPAVHIKCIMHAPIGMELCRENAAIRYRP